MPELPDLTVFAESLEKLCLNRPIREATYHRAKRLNIAPDQFGEALCDRKFQKIERIGKQLLFTLSGGRRFTVSLMLSGGFEWAKEGEEKPRSPIFSVTFAAGELLSLVDQRFLSSVTFDPDLEHLPPDALKITPEYLEEKCREKPRTLIKALIIDQQVIGGIGNAYSDEILWHARISPRSLAGKLPKDAVARLAQSTVTVLEGATTHLRSHYPGMISGEVRDFLSVHRREAKESPTGRPIIVEEIASKRTYYTDEQTLYT